MNSKHLLAATIYSSLLVLGMSGAAIAQSNTAPQGTTGGTMQGGTATQQGATAQGGTAVTTGRGLVGMEVRNSQNKVLGEVANVLVGDDGSIKAIVLGSGGVLGIGESQYVVPWEQVQMSSAQGYITVDAPADKLEAEFSRFEPAPAPAKGTGTGMGTGNTGGMGGPSPSQQMQRGAGGGSGAM